MPTKFVNLGLLALTVALTATGLLMLVMSDGGPLLYSLHRLAGLGLVALLPWKTLIGLRSLRRRLRRGEGRGFAVGVSLPLTALLLVSLALVLAWTLNLVPLWTVAGMPALLLHWYVALALLPLFAYHVYAHWYRRPTVGVLNTRRQFLRASALGLGALAAWALLTPVAGALQSLVEARRFTGSRAVGDFTGNAMPVTMLLTDNPAPVDPAAWRLTVERVGGAPTHLDLVSLAVLPSTTLTATLDCTNGWWSTQDWAGVRLRDVLAHAGIDADGLGAVRVVSLTGHSVTLPLAQVGDALLATHIGGAPLIHGHGAPLRLAHPALRGWLWIKWVDRVQALAPGDT